MPTRTNPFSIRFLKCESAIWLNLGTLIFAPGNISPPADYRVFGPVLEKLSWAMDQGLLHAEEEGKFTEVSCDWS